MYKFVLAGVMGLVGYAFGKKIDSEQVKKPMAEKAVVEKTMADNPDVKKAPDLIDKLEKVDKAKTMPDDVIKQDTQKPVKIKED